MKEIMFNLSIGGLWVCGVSHLVMWGRDIHTRDFRSEKGCRIRVTHVHARSDCVHTRDDTGRLSGAALFVRAIYSSHIVSIKLGAVTPLRRCGLAVHER